jgi:hypothetical protein
VHTELFDPGDLGGDMGGEALVIGEFVEDAGVTTHTTTIRYASREDRDAAVKTGMTDGMEMSYKKLDAMLVEAPACCGGRSPPAGGVVVRIDVGGSGRADAGDLNDDTLSARHREVIGVRRLAVHAAGRQRLERRLAELRAISEVPGARDDRRDAVVRMRVRLDPGVRPHAKQHRVQTGLRGIAPQHDGLRA